MKAAAFRYADGGPPSPEIKLKSNLDTYGADAVLGRRLWAREIYRMNYSANIKSYYDERGQSQNWSVWASNNRAKAKALAEAELLYNKLFKDGE